jgi:SsrA-binding protein
LTLVPLRLYWKGNRVKLEIGLAKGKRQYDKRETIAARDARREMDRAVRTRV